MIANVDDLLLVMVVSPGDASIGCDGIEHLRRLGVHAPALIGADGPAEDYPPALRERIAAIADGGLCWMGSRAGWPGLPQTMVRLYREALVRSGWRVILKLDPDALVLDARLIDDLYAVLNGGAAMAGTFRFHPDGSRRRPGTFALRPLLDCLPLGPLRSIPSGRINWLSLRRPRYARLGLMFRAWRGGCGPGEHVLGGLYGLTRAGLEGAAAIGFLDEVAGSLGIYAIEDGLLSLYVAASGQRLEDLNFRADGTPRSPRRAWIQWPPLPLDLDPARLSAAHPLKPRDDALRQRLLARTPA
jgi:hypothetical protein